MQNYYHPTLEDVYTVRKLLLAFVPAELAVSIVEEAEYWPKVTLSAEFTAVVTISEYSSPFCCLVTPKISNWVGVNEKFRVRKVDFGFQSHDQGWASENNFPTNYMNSWTWFEAAIVRDFKFTENDIAEDVIVASIQDAINGKRGKRPLGELTLVSNPTAPKENAWKIQLNVRASKSFHVHRVSWKNIHSTSRDDEQKSLAESGTGLGIGFVESLKHDDRIAVVAKARFPGWSNFIKSVDIDLFYSD